MTYVSYETNNHEIELKNFSDVNRAFKIAKRLVKKNQTRRVKIVSNELKTPYVVAHANGRIMVVATKSWALV